MNTEVAAAIRRLDTILPLQAGLRSLDSNEAGLYCTILDSYIRKGRTLTRAEASALIDDADSALSNIARHKLIVLDADGNPSGAYPFTSEERQHRISVNGVTVHCMCALDALAVSPMFNLPAEINSQCRVTGRKVQLIQDGYNFTQGTLDVWFGIDWDAATAVACCADSLCTEMIFLANESVARQWQSERESTRELFNLESALTFATGFFVPLIEHCKQPS